MSYIISPDADDVLAAISIVHGGASIVPDDLDGAVSHTISLLGPEAIRYCARMSNEYKRGFLVGWAERMRSSDLKGNVFKPDDPNIDTSFKSAGKSTDFKRGFYIGFCNAPVNGE